MVELLVCVFQAYHPEDDSELTINQGEIIEVLSREEVNWWYGRKRADGKEGYFPVDYVRDHYEEGFVPAHSEGQDDQAQLEQQQKLLEEASATKISSWWKMTMSKRRYLYYRKCVITMQSIHRGRIERKKFKPIWDSRHLAKIAKPTGPGLKHATRARGGAGRRPPTRRRGAGGKAAGPKIEYKMSTEDDATVHKADENAPQEKITKTLGGPNVLTFDPTKIQLKKQTPRPQQKPAPAAQESEIAKIQLKKATPVEKPAPKPSGGGFDLSQIQLKKTGRQIQEKPQEEKKENEFAQIKLKKTGVPPAQKGLDSVKSASDPFSSPSKFTPPTAGKSFIPKSTAASPPPSMPARAPAMPSRPPASPHSPPTSPHSLPPMPSRNGAPLSPHSPGLPPRSPGTPPHSPSTPPPMPLRGGPPPPSPLSPPSGPPLPSRNDSGLIVTAPPPMPLRDPAPKSGSAIGGGGVKKLPAGAMALPLCLPSVQSPGGGEGGAKKRPASMGLSSKALSHAGIVGVPPPMPARDPQPAPPPTSPLPLPSDERRQRAGTTQCYGMQPPPPQLPPAPAPTPSPAPAPAPAPAPNPHVTLVPPDQPAADASMSYGGSMRQESRPEPKKGGKHWEKRRDKSHGILSRLFSNRSAQPPSSFPPPPQSSQSSQSSQTPPPHAAPPPPTPIPPPGMGDDPPPPPPLARDPVPDDGAPPPLPRDPGAPPPAEEGDHGDAEVPHFEDDPKNVSFCTACNRKFNMIHIKRQCRSCRRFFCSKCSKKSKALPSKGFNKPVRVCDRCFLA